MLERRATTGLVAWIVRRQSLPFGNGIDVDHSGKTCFVIMGFGKKTDYGMSTRTLDLDKDYAAIIQPAVIGCGLRCIRADELQQSGMIDRPMYQLLLSADLVIADISTANANALYELGTRCGPAPRSS